MNIEKELNSQLLEEYSRDPSVIKELLRYTKNGFTSRLGDQHSLSLPLCDEAYVAAWDSYLKEADNKCVFEVLKSHLVQLKFPVKKNMSKSPEYRAATLKGTPIHCMLSATGLVLKEAHLLELKMYQSAAGKIPVLVVANHEDFCALVRALANKNEPIPIPASMGAAMINGLNNWSRIQALKRQWLRTHPTGNWKQHFMKSIVPNKTAYQDKLIVLSRKPYSGISHHLMGFSKEKWARYSLDIRLEHECAHFFTLRYFGHMANTMHDELVADYMGITKVLGRFSSEWFLKFVGLENYPNYRPGGRLENYCVTPPLSRKGIYILQDIIKRASDNVVAFDQRIGKAECKLEPTKRLLTLCSLDLLQIASKEGFDKLLEQYQGIDPEIKIKSRETYEEQKITQGSRCNTGTRFTCAGC